MDPVSATTAIDAPRQRVFDFLCDLANRPAIGDHFIAEYRLQRMDSTGVGAAARFLVKRRKIWMEIVIEEVEPPHRIAERGRAGRLGRTPVSCVWELVDGEAPGTSLATVSFWTEPAHPLDRMRERLGAARWYRRRWARALTRLRDVLEGGVEVERVEVAGADRLPLVT